MGNYYDKRSLVKYLVILIGVMLIMKATGGAGFAVVVPLLLMSMAKRRQEDMLFYLVLTGTSVVGNANLMPKDVTFFIVQRSILTVLAVALSTQIFGRRMPPALKPLTLLFVYLAFMVLPSSLGWCPVVSYLKIALFLICYMAYLAVSCKTISTVRVAAPQVRSILLAFGIFYLLGSVVLIPFPAISQLSSESYMDAVAAGKEVTSLFTGMTNQSQCLGPVVAVLSCCIFGDLVFCIRRWNKLYLLLLACCPVLVFKTSSRTAAGSYLISFAIMVYYFLKARGIAVRWKSKVASVVMGLLVISSAVLMASPDVRQGAVNFLMKWSKDSVASDVSIESVYSSRQGIMDRALENFKESPMIGNGFQVSKEMANLKVTSLKQVLSAPIEKGVWVTAILEEGGLCGFGIFLLFVISAVVMLGRAKAYIGCSALITFIISNMGEFTFFSMSYIGGFMWSMVFLCLILDTLRNRDDWRPSVGIPTRVAFGSKIMQYGDGGE